MQPPASCYVEIPLGGFWREAAPISAARSTSTCTCMTGEITLRGRVLPIGGLKEKLIAALRGRLKTVLIPKDNEKDLAEIPDNVKRGLSIKAVATVDEVLADALTEPLEAIEWIESPEVESVSAVGGDTDDENVVRH